MKAFKLCLFVAILVLGTLYTTVLASPTLDLSGSTDSGSLVGAVGGTAQFILWNGQPAGSGIYDPFLRLGANGTESGYNTSAHVKPLDDQDFGGSTFNHAQSLDGFTGPDQPPIPIVNIGGVDYREFALDLNQQGGNPLLSLDLLRIYQGNVDNLTGFDAGTPAGASLIWDMGSLDSQWVGLNFDKNKGGLGIADLLVYIPASDFSSGQFVYLYSTFGTQGGDWTSNDGFEQWGVRLGSTPPTIPAPGAILLGGIGVTIVGWFRKRRAL